MTNRNNKKSGKQKPAPTAHIGLSSAAVAASLLRLRVQYGEMLRNLAKGYAPLLEGSDYETQMAAAERVMAEDREALQKLAE